MTYTPPVCPACGAADVVKGKFTRRIAFVPAGLRFWTWTVTMLPLINRSDPWEAPMSSMAHACRQCGLVWTHTDAERLRTVMREAGRDPG